MSNVVAFRPPLPAALAAANTHYLASGTSASCPQANPAQAAANQLCFYLTGSAGTFTLDQIIDPTLNGGGAATTGAELVLTITAANAIARGTWAYTAP